MATIVAFHAHPDDEVLLTGGTIAALAAAGHRVIIVAATDGEVWPGPVPASGWRTPGERRDPRRRPGRAPGLRGQRARGDPVR